MNVVPRIVELKGSDPEAAFHETQHEARHAYGNSGQTGSIADADGCIVVSGPALLAWDCRRTAQQVIREGHAKAGGPVFILRVTDPGKTKQVKALVDITGLAAGPADDAIDAAVRSKLPGEGWGIVAVELRGQEAEGEEKKGVTKTRTSLVAGKGRKITRYSVRQTGTGREVKAFDTLPEAKAWMKEALEAGSGPLHCVGEILKEDGPLLAGETQELKRTVVANATIGTIGQNGNGLYLAAGIFPIGE